MRNGPAIRLEEYSARVSQNEVVRSRRLLRDGAASALRLGVRGTAAARRYVTRLL